MADLEFLDLELQGLTDEYTIDPVNRVVKFKGDEEFIRLRVAHLEKVKGKTTLYADFVNKFGDANAYAFHNLYPYMGLELLPMLKNDLLFIEERKLEFTTSELQDILEAIENRKWQHPDPRIYKLMLVVYFDTVDAFVRTSRYNKKGKVGLFIEKLNYIKIAIKRRWKLKKNTGLNLNLPAL
ncbi:MAG: hypothetical protein ABIN73_09705 [candidate division WOR-3 bacterium]